MIFKIENDGIEFAEPKLKLEGIPIWATSYETRKKLSKLLNQEMLLKSEDGYFRDWRGLLQLSGIEKIHHDEISKSDEKIHKIIQFWMIKFNETGQSIDIDQFLKSLEMIDRNDVYDDIRECLEKDVKVFSSNSLKTDVADNALISMKDKNQFSMKRKKMYDAYVLYNENDSEFASNLIEKCEKEMGFELFVRDRDITPGAPIEMNELIEIIANQCNHIIVVVSKAFLNSPNENFLTDYAQSLGIQQEKRKVIPCIKEECELPLLLKFCYVLRFYDEIRFVNWWDKLRAALSVDSIKAINDESSVKDSMKKEICLNENFNQKVENIKSSNISSSPEKIRKIFFPPAAKQRQISESKPSKGENFTTPQKNEHSRSNFYLNETDPMESIKKSNKWYKKIIPKSMRSKAKIRQKDKKMEKMFM